MAQPKANAIWLADRIPTERYFKFLIYLVLLTNNTARFNGNISEKYYFLSYDFKFIGFLEIVCNNFEISFAVLVLLASSENTIILFVCPPKFCISIVFVFSRDHCKSQEKLETMLMQNLGAQTKSIMVFSRVAYSTATHHSKQLLSVDHHIKPHHVDQGITHEYSWV